MKEKFIKHIKNMTEEEFRESIEQSGCPGKWGLKEKDGDCLVENFSCVECWKDALANKENVQREESGKLKTLEMMNVAKETGKTYKSNDLCYNDKKGFTDREGKVWKVGGDISLNYFVELNDWEEVKQLVTWQEALEAWANGNAIECELSGERKVYQGFYERLVPSCSSYAVGKSEINNGTWYILDKAE